jgi:hypothetical protein
MVLVITGNYFKKINIVPVVCTMRTHSELESRIPFSNYLQITLMSVCVCVYTYACHLPLVQLIASILVLLQSKNFLVTVLVTTSNY